MTRDELEARFRQEGAQLGLPAYVIERVIASGLIERWGEVELEDNNDATSQL